MSEERPSPEFVELQRNRSQRSIALLAKLQGIKKKNVNDDWSDEQILQLNPDKLMSDILDRLTA